MSDDGSVLYEVHTVMPSGAIVEVFVRDADPGKYPGGVKYRLHYGFPGADHPVVRYDNSHGYHERHEGDDVRSFEFPGPDELYERFIEEVLSHERRQTD